MATFFDETIQVSSGTTTAWLPLSTPWVSIAACSAQIYAQRAGLGGNLIAFDPLYGESIIPSAIPCLPTEVTSSWYQSNPSTTTLLGPTFVCPGAYSAVQTILVNTMLQQVLCCPSQYSLNVQITGKATFPEQYTSLLTYGQTITYESTTPAGPWGPATSTVPESAATTSVGPTVVFAMHVNGFNSITTTTSTSSAPSIGATGSALCTTSSTISVTAPKTSSPTAAVGGISSKSLSSGATAAVAISVVTAVVAVAVVSWFLWRRRVKRRNISEQPFLVKFGSTVGPNEVEGTSIVMHEMDSASKGQQHKSMYELAG